MPSLPERTDWLDPEDDDESPAQIDPERQRDVDVEVSCRAPSGATDQADVAARRLMALDGGRNDGTREGIQDCTVMPCYTWIDYIVAFAHGGGCHLGVG